MEASHVVGTRLGMIECMPKWEGQGGAPSKWFVIRGI